MKRRNFLKGSLGTLYMMASPNMAFPDVKLSEKRLLVVLLRGGLDGLAAVPPLADKNLSKIRKDVLVQGANDLDGFFGIHPNLKFLENEYHSGNAAFVHATSFPYTGRSHFDGQNIMETGSEQAYAVTSGWVGRAMNAAGFSSLAVSLPIPIILRGNEVNSNYFPTNFSKATKKEYAEVEKMWKSDSQLNGMLKDISSRDTMKHGRGDTIDLVGYAASQMHKTNGPRVGLLEIDGFDTHALQGNEQGEHAELLEDLDNILRVFKERMGPLYDDTAIVTVTEFGRTAFENGTQGTDHGWASSMILAGGLVKGKQVVSDWPGLSKRNLFEDRDLTMTIDARDIYAEVVKTVFDLEDDVISEHVFLGYKPEKYYGLLKKS
ncbi:DUF1501 domain-containing protein [Amylibacter sp.]|mgnify:FL=1|jgi:uncharacterized protein (DUF1501 family)|nr:DUF1501 domain-containing protein [Amylibacter sp.]MDB9918768.1 DUF1501 domain-containing protein [Amylibacter sp.]|tara:strand:+ start:1666 stop:2796 length:1131 start_codon:yes stop_codon:yes gene_type:complete